MEYWEVKYLNDNTALDKVIKGDVSARRSVEFPDQSVVKPV